MSLPRDGKKTVFVEDMNNQDMGSGAHNCTPRSLEMQDRAGLGREGVSHGQL